MKEMDEYGLSFCKLQANIFANSAERVPCSSPVFLRRYMNSSFAEEMDRTEEYLEPIDAETAYRAVEEEYGKSRYGSIRYTYEELYWMGYLYRYWCYTHETTSKNVYRIIKPNELRTLYYPYHSLDPSAATERILESKKIDEDDYLRKGVEILRERTRAALGEYDEMKQNPAKYKRYETFEELIKEVL